MAENWSCPWVIKPIRIKEICGIEKLKEVNFNRPKSEMAFHVGHRRGYFDHVLISLLSNIYQLKIAVICTVTFKLVIS